MKYLNVHINGMKIPILISEMIMNNDSETTAKNISCSFLFLKLVTGD